MFASLFAVFRRLYERSNQPHHTDCLRSTECLDSRKQHLAIAESEGGIRGRSWRLFATLCSVALSALVLSRWSQQHLGGLVQNRAGQSQWRMVVLLNR